VFFVFVLNAFCSGTIASIEKAKEDAVAWNNLPPTERKAKEDELSSAVSRCKVRTRISSEWDVE
jgi:hypothetical protein